MTLPDRRRLIAWLDENWLSFLWTVVFVGFLCAWLRETVPTIRADVCLVIFSLGVVISILFHRFAVIASWIGFGTVLFTIWIYHGRGHWFDKVILLVTVCIIFFILEGLELAYTELRDKDPESLNDRVQSERQQKIDTRLRRAVAEINVDRSIFYHSRELIAVLLVALITVEADFDRISFPLIGSVSERPWTLGFSLVFTSVLLIWFSQSPSKELATRNSLAFVKAFSLPHVWLLLKPIGSAIKKLKATSPAELIVQAFESSSTFQKTRNLAPSHRQFYCDAVRCYSYAYHIAEDAILVRANGSAQFHHRCLIYVSPPAQRSHFTVKYAFDENVLSEKLQRLVAYEIPASEEQLTESYEQYLLDLFDERLSAMPPEISRLNYQPLISGKEASFGIHSPEPLPRPHSSQSFCAAILFDVLIEIDKGGFKFPQGSGFSNKVTDSWWRKIAVPCGHYHFSLRLEPGVSTQIAEMQCSVFFLNEEHQRESERVGTCGTSSNQQYDYHIKYPMLTGADYRITWELWPG